MRIVNLRLCISLSISIYKLIVRALEYVNFLFACAGHPISVQNAAFMPIQGE